MNVLFSVKRRKSVRFVLLVGAICAGHVLPLWSADCLGSPALARPAACLDYGYDCTVSDTQSTVGAGCCPGGSGSQCETRTWTRTSQCRGDCPPNKSCAVFEEMTGLVYEQWVYSGNCNSPSNCIAREHTARMGWIITSCHCVNNKPTGLES